MASVNVSELLRLYNDPSISTTDLCFRLRISSGSLHRLRMRYGLPLRPMQKPNVKQADPTPEEIAERAAECRERRTKEETARAEKSGRVRYRLPVYAYDGRDCAFTGTAY